MKTKLFVPLAILVIVTTLLAACSSPAQPQVTSNQTSDQNLEVVVEVTNNITVDNGASASGSASGSGPAAPAAPASDLAPADTGTGDSAPTQIECSTPSIRADVYDSTGGSEKGLYLNTELGERMTLTSRSLLIDKVWNEPLTSDELKMVEDTIQYVVVCIPDGFTGRIFAGGVAQGSKYHERGALITLNPGRYSFQMRNGEIVIWYPGQDNFSAQDLQRIIKQIREGNFDIMSPLSIFVATEDLKLPEDFKIEIIPYLIPDYK